jgi:hypothetical protein
LFASLLRRSFLSAGQARAFDSGRRRQKLAAQSSSSRPNYGHPLTNAFAPLSKWEDCLNSVAQGKPDIAGKLCRLDDASGDASTDGHQALIQLDRSQPGCCVTVVAKEDLAAVHLENFSRGNEIISPRVASVVVQFVLGIQNSHKE